MHRAIHQLVFLVNGVIFAERPSLLFPSALHWSGGILNLPPADLDFYPLIYFVFPN